MLLWSEGSDEVRASGPSLPSSRSGPAVKGGPTGPSEASGEAAPLTAGERRLRRRDYLGNGYTHGLIDREHRPLARAETAAMAAGRLEQRGAWLALRWVALLAHGRYSRVAAVCPALDSSRGVRRIAWHQGPGSWPVMMASKKGSKRGVPYHQPTVMRLGIV